MNKEFCYYRVILDEDKKHKEYWFKCSSRFPILPGTRVRVDTSKGEATGVVTRDGIPGNVEDAVGITNREFGKIKYVSSILLASTYLTFPIHMVRIPQQMISHPPTVEKLSKKYRNWMRSGRIDPVIVNQDLEIVDGYINFILTIISCKNVVDIIMVGGKENG